MILLKNGKNSRNESMNILIKENKIHKIFNGNEKIDVESNDLQIIELQDKLILPGIIDPHTHMRDPGFTAKEDFTTGSKACAKGGITTFMDMPNTNPATITYESLLSKKKINKLASLVFVVSISTESPSVGNALYSASKGALLAYTKCLSIELAPRGIRVNCISPAMVWTDLIIKDGVDEEMLREDEKKSALGRYGKPEDIAGLTVYLLSDISNWMTGGNINITGGSR